MDKIEWIEPYYDIMLNMVPKDCKTILDVGAGSGIFGFILKKTRSAYLTAIEPFGYDLSHYDMVHRCKWGHDTINDDFDCIVSSEMIEHMTHGEAMAFLHDIRKFGKKIIIATPYIFEQQPAYDGNPYQVHKCVISEHDFAKYGFSIRFIGTVSFRGFTARVLVHPKLKPFIKLIGCKITNMVGTYEGKRKA